MAGLRWVRLDTTFPSNQKVLDLAYANRHRAITVYLCGLAYAGAQGTDGWIPASALPILHARRSDAQHLVDAQLWLPIDGGWQIHDWHDYQPTTDTLNTRHQDRVRRARAAANIRWHGTPDP